MISKISFISVNLVVLSDEFSKKFILCYAKFMIIQENLTYVCVLCCSEVDITVISFNM